MDGLEIVELMCVKTFYIAVNFVVVLDWLYYNMKN